MEEKQKYEIKETKEFLKATALIVAAVKKIKRDGLKPESLNHLYDLITKYDALIEGFTDMKEIKKELLDLDKVEVIELIGELYSAVKTVEDA